jgi:hypothetical protein
MQSSTPSGPRKLTIRLASSYQPTDMDQKKPNLSRAGPDMASPADQYKDWILGPEQPTTTCLAQGPRMGVG